MTSVTFSIAPAFMFAQEVEAIGFTTKGVVEIVNVQPHNGKAKPYQAKQVCELLLKYKIDIEWSDWGERHGR